jgi:hypothetical protein
LASDSDILSTGAEILDFIAVLLLITKYLEENEYLYAVIGGVGLGALGMPRTTFDLDLVVESRAQEDIVRFLESRGYETLHRSSGYSNHEHPDEDFGAIDFIYVKGETVRLLFESVRLVEGPSGYRLPVPHPEHLIAMKVLAMKNDPKRVFREMEDIRFLMDTKEVDRERVRGYFEKHGLLNRFHDLEETS